MEALAASEMDAESSESEDELKIEFEEDSTDDEARVVEIEAQGESFHNRSGAISARLTNDEREPREQNG